MADLLAVLDPDYCPECGVGVVRIIEATDKGYQVECSFCRKTLVMNETLDRVISVLF